MKLVFTVSYWWFVCFSYPHLSPASGGFAPRAPFWGLRPQTPTWTPLEVFHPPDSLICPLSKFLATSLFDIQKSSVDKLAHSDKDTAE